MNAHIDIQTVPEGTWWWSPNWKRVIDDTIVPSPEGTWWWSPNWKRVD